MDIKKFLVDELNKIEEISRPFKEKVKIEEPEPQYDEQETIEVNREVVLEYLMKSGYDMTQDNYDRAEQMLISMESGKLKRTLDEAGKPPKIDRYTIIDHLNDLSVEDLGSLLDIAVLNALNNINSNTKPILPIKYEYAVETVKDLAGGTNVLKLNQILREYSEKGYRAISFFTNELGKNTMSINNIGVNSTVDQVVIIFEKPIYEE